MSIATLALPWIGASAHHVTLIGAERIGVAQDVGLPVRQAASDCQAVIPALVGGVADGHHGERDGGI